MALIEKLTAIADAIRAKTGKPAPLTLDQMAAEIALIETGMTLDPLNNPAAPENIHMDYAAYDSNGQVIYGNARTYEEGRVDGFAEGHEAGVRSVYDVLPNIANPASSEHIYPGYQALDGSLNLMEGTARTYDEGYEEGKQAGYEEGHEAGRQSVYNELPTLSAQATSEHIHFGYQALDSSLTVIDGAAWTYEEGYEDGRQAGYDEGYVVGKAEGGGAEDITKSITDRSATELTIPDGVTTVAMYAFYNWSTLQKVRLPDSVRTIDGNAFGGCTKMDMDKLPEGLTSIANYAFNSCRALSIKEIPAKVSSIGGNSFANCTNLTEIIFLGQPSSINSLAFNGCTNITDIYTCWPNGAVAGAPWGATSATIHYNSL